MYLLIIWNYDHLVHKLLIATFNPLKVWNKMKLLGFHPKYP